MTRPEFFTRQSVDGLDMLDQSDIQITCPGSRHVQGLLLSVLKPFRVLLLGRYYTNNVSKSFNGVHWNNQNRKVSKTCTGSDDKGSTFLS